MCEEEWLGLSGFIVGARHVDYGGVTHLRIMHKGRQVIVCGKLSIVNAEPVAGREVSCKQCAEIMTYKHDPKGGRLTTSSKYGRVTLAEFNRREDAALAAEFGGSGA